MLKYHSWHDTCSIRLVFTTQPESRNTEHCRFLFFVLKPLDIGMSEYLLMLPFIVQPDRWTQTQWFISSLLQKAVDLMSQVPKLCNDMMNLGRLQGYEVRPLPVLLINNRVAQWRHQSKDVDVCLSLRFFCLHLLITDKLALNYLSWPIQSLCRVN